MQNRVRAIASIITLGVFIYFALASFGSTNTKVVPQNCDPKPDYTGELLIGVDYFAADGTPIPFVVGTIFLVHQRVQDTMTCQSLVISSELIDFNSGNGGLFNYSTPTFTHSNAGDLWRVEVSIPAVAGKYLGVRKTKVAKYNTTYLPISFTAPAPL